MTVIAFRPRWWHGVGTDHGAGGGASSQPCVTGTFRSPRGRSGLMKGILRVRALDLGAGAASLDGVFTAELRERDGSLIGVDSRRMTVPADLEPHASGRRLLVGPLDLDLMGITVRVQRFAIDPSALPGPGRGLSSPTGRGPSEEGEQR